MSSESGGDNSELDQQQYERDQQDKQNLELFVEELKAGKSAKSNGEAEHVVEETLLKAFDIRPTRAEPLQELATYFRGKDMYNKAYIYAQAARTIPFPEQDGVQFARRTEYIYRPLYEIGIAAFYVGLYQQGLQANLEILHWYDYGLYVPDHIVEVVKRNLEHYRDKVREEEFPFPQNAPFTEYVQEKVDKVFFINLDNRTERRQRMESLLDKFGLDYERFSAIGPASMNMEDYMEQHSIQTLKHLSHGEVGCFMSHYRVLEDTIKNGYDHAIILEDDVSFLPPFLTVLPAVLEELETLDLSWDIIMLGQERYIHGKDRPVPGSKYLVDPLFSLGAAGYLVSPRGAAKIVESRPLSKMVEYDNFLQYLSGKVPFDSFHNNTLNLLMVQPALLTGGGFTSDTNPKR
ncbi:MAG: hypothetical protein SGILL_003064 [Bacillariaceae sp.]